MGRRKRAGLIQDIFDLLAQLPWWVGVIAAGVFWIASGMLFNESNGRYADVRFATMGHAIGRALAAVALFASAKSAIKSISRLWLLRQTRGLEAIRAISWRQFEQLVGEAYRQRGYTVSETGGGGADGGVDLKLHRRGETTLIQCKQWKTRQVGVDKVRELYGVMMAERADRGILVSSGFFTRDAQAFASGKPLELVDGPALLKLVESVQNSSRQSISQPPPPQPSAPACPRCGGPTVLRTAKRGPTAGAQFYGCANYPACKGTAALGS